ncbi:MAG: dipeptide epimerase [Rhodospirillaceae bacterium]|nr:dipeptide epimerase [Rhodospirillaceae bacterium]
MRRTVSAKHESWPLAQVFRIARGAKTAADVIVVEILQDGVRGWAEAVPYPRYNQTIESCLAEIESIHEAIAEGANRHDLLSLLKPSAARNAIDCALWDLEAKMTGTPVWHLAGLDEPVDLVTAYTLSIDSPEAMGEAAAQNSHRPLLKIKLDGEFVLERLEAVRAGAPESRLVVDANEGWSAELLGEIGDALKELGVAMIEQPLPAEADGALKRIDCPVTLCADESCHGSDTVADLADRYGMVNIKLDKTGGLTEALNLRRAAMAAGLEVMVGCMVGTSLAMAPAMLVAQGAKVVDLDGPLLMKMDRDLGVTFDGNTMLPCPSVLWG